MALTPGICQESELSRPVREDPVWGVLGGRRDRAKGSEGQERAALSAREPMEPAPGRHTLRPNKLLETQHALWLQVLATPTGPLRLWPVLQERNLFHSAALRTATFRTGSLVTSCPSACPTCPSPATSWWTNWESHLRKRLT